MERIGGLHQPYTPRPSQAATRYCLRDHAPSSLQASLLKTTGQGTPKFSLFETARLHEGLPALVRVGTLTHSKSLSTLPALSAHICLYVTSILQTASTTAPQRGVRMRTSKPDGYLQESRSDHLWVSRSFDWRAASYPLDQAPTNAYHAFQVGCGCHTRAPKPISVSFVCRGAEARNSPFRRPSCQVREEKRKFSPTANSLRRHRQQSRT